ncbi:MAG TPA: hypothetical protein VIO60_01415 [Rectinemataceae bacterium]
MMKRYRAAIAAACLGLASIMAACDLGSSSNDTPTRLQVAVQINRSVDYDGTTGVVWYFDIEYDGSDIDGSAVVRVNSTTIAPTYGFTGWTYKLEESGGATFVPGQDYQLSVSYGGSTYTQTVRIPGGITVSPDYRQVSWNYGGGHSTISVNHTYGSDTYKYPGSLGSLTSPHSLPASAYPTTGQYDLRINIGSLISGFGSLRGNKSYVWAYDFLCKRFTK